MSPGDTSAPSLADPLEPSVTSTVTIGLSFQDMTADDFLTVNFELDGSHAAGSGGAASFFIDNGITDQNIAEVTCNSFNQQFHAVDCFAGASAQVIIPLANVDSLFLTWELQASVGGTGTGSADYFNSDDFSITVPRDRDRQQPRRFSSPRVGRFSSPRAALRSADRFRPCVRCAVRETDQAPETCRLSRT